jgi:tripartite motif-containing protein 71
MKRFSVPFILIIILLSVIPASAKKVDKPFAAWPLPDGLFAYITPNDETKIRIVDTQGMWKGSHIKEVGTGALLMPWDMVGTPDGWLLVLDRMKATVNVYDEDFDFQYSIGEKGTGDGQLKSPQALAIDARGFVYIANNGNNRIEKFNSDGDHVAYIEPQSGEGVGTEFKYITAMVASPEGKLYVAVDSDDPSVMRNIYIYDGSGDLQGKFLTAKWGGQGRFSDLFLNADGTLLVVDAPASTGGFAGAIWHVNPDGELMRKYEAYDNDFDRFYSPVEVIMRDGRMYTFCAESKCLVLTSSGGFLYSFGL